MKNAQSKFVVLLAAVALSLAAFSCSGDDDGNNGNNGNNQTVDTGGDTTEDDTTDEDTGSAGVQEVDCAQATIATTVSMASLAYDPASVTIGPGDVVEWSNDEPTAVNHTVTSGRAGDDTTGEMFDSGNIAPDESFCLQFDTAGDYQYFCELHPTQMNDGVVTVE